MEYLVLKNTDLRVSRIGMGCCAMGQYGWGEVREQELVAAVHTALDQGINFFDTADTYGLGTSERTLGKALGSRRAEAVIATKFGVRVGEYGTVYDNAPQWIRTSCEGSLKRLGTDYIDLYQVHYRDGKTEIGAVVEALLDLQRQGKIRYFGLSNVDMRELSALAEFRGSFATIQEQYSLACREREGDILETSESLNATVVTWGSLGQGILTGKYDASSKFGSDDRRSRSAYVNFHGEKLQKNLQIVSLLREIGREYGKPPGAVALRYILDHLPGSVALCGAKNPGQILGNLESQDWHLGLDMLQKLDAISR